MQTNRLAGIGSIVALCGLASAQAGSCNPSWDQNFALPGWDVPVTDVVEWNDGTGPALYMTVARAGIGNSTSAPAIAKWDGQNFQSLPVSTTAQRQMLQRLAGKAITVFDPDGAGPLPSKLVFAGSSVTGSGNVVLQWDGTTLSYLGSVIGAVSDLQVHNGELYACGSIRSSSGDLHLLKWTGSDWTDIGGSMRLTADTCTGMAFCDADADGSEELYVIGKFTFIGTANVPANRFAKWDGEAWSAVPGYLGVTPTTTNPPLFIKSLNLGDGPSLLLGGVQYNGVSSAQTVVRLNNNTWSTLMSAPVPNDPNVVGWVYDVSMFPGPSGPELHAVGQLYNNGQAATGASTFGMLARRSPEGTWELLGGTGPSDPTLHKTSVGQVPSFVSPVDLDLAGPGASSLLLSGNFSYLPGALYSPDNVLWDGSSFVAPHTGTNSLGTLNVTSIRELDLDGNGPQSPTLFVTFSWLAAGDRAVYTSIVSYDGSQFTTLPDGVPYVSDVATFDSGTGVELYAARQGADTSDLTQQPAIFRLRNSAWEQLALLSDSAGDTGAHVSRMLQASVDGTPALLIAGSFSELGSVSSRGVARFDGTNFVPMDAGLPISADPNILTRLYVTEMVLVNSVPHILTRWETTDRTTFETSQSHYEIYAWNGSAWTLVPGQPMNSDPFNPPNFRSIKSLTINSTQSLYVCGFFSDISGAPGTENIARWDGSAWQSVGGGVQHTGNGGPVDQLAAHDFGNGPELVISVNSGGFVAGGVPINGLARFDGFNWHQVPGTEHINVLTGLYTSSNTQYGGIYTTGIFRLVGSSPGALSATESRGMARLITRCPCPADFNSSGSVTVQDIFDYLAAWFASSPAADFNASGTVTVQDIFDFLAAWFQGC